MTRRYLNPATKNQSTESLERALEILEAHTAEAPDLRWKYARKAIDRLRTEIEFRKEAES